MYDVEKIGKIIADIEHYFDNLKELKVRSPVMTTERFYSLSMVLFAILNRTIDLGQETIRGKKLGMPASYKEIFQIIEREKVISVDLSKKLQYLVNQRNVLAHEYFDVTEKSIYEVYLKINIVTELVSVVKALLSSNNNGRKK